ncbi:polar amino acid transport system substrate-binding protein [Enterococcus sp. PF1-24]|uniref:transporter substrate-binding domain-containing protein n=1 Tax=unclassified Enterococcus TaxID=2608891 RepID=UPI002474751D|nr:MULTISPECIES: transporter substrate-binding domain-containing protein [unclassified Enterococcus]MDH6363650.1 polar amino acid transport system substrate-binding protein [Enterococcus sp. PFB1-1]MDH6400885.1 polar amino acid transport system substrate-binding protein [Enterococcus sp. PF1-24]
MKKFLSLLATGLMVMTMAACGNDAKAESSKTTEQDSLTAIKEAGVLKVATSADFAPFEFHALVDGKDKIVGADVDLIAELAKDLGVEVEYMDMEFNAVLTALQQGKVDIAISGISATLERQESFDFSVNYYNPPQVVVINKKNADVYTDLASLKGKNVGAQKGSIQEDIVTAQLPDSTKVSVPKVPNLIVELNQGSIEALVLEKTIAESYIYQNPDLMLAEIELTSSEDEAYAIALPKDSGDLKTEIDKSIQKLIDNGQIEEFVDKNIQLANQQAE